MNASTLSWMLASCFLHSSLDTYSLSTSSLGCKALYIVMTFPLLWSVSWSSSLVHFKNDYEYLTRGAVQVCNPLMRFLLCNLILSFSFIFYLITACLMVSASNIPRYLLVSFFPSVLIFSWFGSSLLSVICCLHFSLLVWRILYSKFHPYILAVYPQNLY